MKPNRFFILFLFSLVLSLSACSINPYRLNFLSSEGPRYAVLDEYSKENPIKKDTIKIISYNIEWSRKINRAIELFKTHEDLKDADIICLQEMSIQGTEQMAKELGYNYVYYPAVIHPIPKRSFGNAVLSRWPILDDQKIILPKDSEKKLQRIAVAATISINGKKIKIYSVHLEVYIDHFQRRAHVKRIIKSLPDDINYYIITGDFNTFTKRHRQALFDEFIENDFTHVTKDIGWTHKNPYFFNRKASVDHIFVKEINSINMGKIDNRSASDHIPIWAELRFK